MTEIILIVVLALLSSWEEINELYRDGSWKRDMFYPFLFWETNPNSKWKNFDSKHISFGLFTLVFIYILYTKPDLYVLYLINQSITDILHIIIYWWFLFYIRNLGMHIILRRKSFRQWKYLLPINF